MAKNSVRDFDATAANNTDIQSVDIAENCAPSGINNAIRELMADIKDVSAGTVALESPQADSLTVTGDLTVDTSTLKVDSTNNRVGIGTTSPTSLLQSFNTATTTYSGSTADSTTFRVQTKNNSSTNGQVAAINMVASGNNGSNNASVTLNCIQDSASSHAASFTVQTRASSGTVAERMRIDSSGNLLVGTTDTSPYNNSAGSSADNGVVVSAGRIWAARNSGTPLDLNRTSDDGSIVDFRKNGSVVGSIANNSTNLKVNGVGALELSENGTTRVYVDSGGFFPFLDNTYDIGSGGLRFDDIFATNGTIQTSDQNEKQQIATLTDAEIAAAKRISNGFKTFKWNDAVAAKGDNARTHTGVIAQEVRTALEAEGLDAGNYAFFMSNTWWETQTDVPAVEAVEAQDAVYDDDGNLVSEAVEAVEAQEAYTRTDTYDTAEEAPEGATERTRLGVRYPELLAFVGAATEQRLTSIEARLTALEV